MLVTIISDASHCQRTKLGGYGFWAVSARGRHGGSGSFKQTLRGSMCAETQAVVNALFITLRLGIAAKGDKIIFQTDAQHAIDVFTGIAKKIKDQAVIKARDEFKKLVAQHELTFEFRHVRGHTRVADKRSLAQRNCDQRAKEGLQKARIAAASVRGGGERVRGSEGQQVNSSLPRTANLPLVGACSACRRGCLSAPPAAVSITTHNHGGKS